MSVTVGLDALIGYSDQERAKWRDWIAADPGRLSIAMQPGGRFPTVADLLDHVFFVERRHLCRLEGGTPPVHTGVRIGVWRRLLAYADLVRGDLRRYVADLTDADADGTISWDAVGIGPISMSRRRLLTHILLHEVRHLAQLALAARIAGVEPPGKHDLFFHDGFV